MTKPKRKIASKKPEALFGRIVSILDQARGNVVRAVNSNMVLAYWLIGREIVQELQGGAKRAKYGEKVVEDLSNRLTERYGKGFSAQTLWKFRLFYQAYSDRILILSPAGIESSEVGKLSPTGRESSATSILSPLGTKSGIAHAKAPTARPKLSPGHRPGYSNPNPALKGRLIHHQQNQMQYKFGRFVSPFQGFTLFGNILPRALPWAFMVCPFGAETVAPTARPNPSPGHRPGYSNRNPNPALKGRPIPCLNLSRVSTSILSSAPSTASTSLQTLCEIRCTPTWPPCCKTWAAILCSSTPWRIMFTFFLNFPAPYRSARRWKRSKNPLPNGLKHREMNLLALRGRQVMVPLPSVNPTLPPSANTLRTNRNTTAKKHFRRNTGCSLKGMGWCLMNDMSGIERQNRSPFQGCLILFVPVPRALPWAGISRPVGANFIETTQKDHKR